MTDYLNLDIDGALKLTPADIVGKMIALMGGTGSGKSYSMGVLAEELMSLFPLTIVDTAGEYWTLQEVFNVLIVGREWWSEGENPVRIDHCNVEISVADAEKIAEYSFRNNVSVILELRYFDPHERNELLSAYFSRLWELILRQPKPQPYGIFIDEAQNYVPQQNSKYSIKGILTKFAKEGRKEGVTCVFGTQRAASISKDVLNMCGMRILHRVYYPTDIEVYADGVPLREAAEVRKLNRELQPGDAIFVNEPDSWVVRMRPRQTTHAGATPTLDGHAPTLREVDKQTVEDLKALLIPVVSPIEGDDSAKDASQRDVITALQRENAAQKKEIVQLRKDVEHWQGLVQGQSIADALPGVQLRMDVEPLPDELLKRAQKRESSAQKRVVNRQMNNLKRLRAETLKLSAAGQEILFWMSRPERHGVWFSIEHIAQRLRLSQNSIRMQELVATKLVERDKSLRIHKFRFKKGYIEASFPDLDTVFVLDHISSIKEKVA